MGELFKSPDAYAAAAAIVSVIGIIITLIITFISEKVNKTSREARAENRRLFDEIVKRDATLKSASLSENTGTFSVNFVSPDAAPSEAERKERFDAKIEELITNHHEQAIHEAKTQFWFSLMTSVAGFLIIIVSFFFPGSAEWYSKLVLTIPGVVMEAVSVLFFSQSKETREQSSDFLNRLREDRKFEKGIAIANTIADDTVKDKLLASIALNLCGIRDVVLQPTGKSPEKTGANPPKGKE